MNKKNVLKQLLDKSGIIIAPGVYDSIGARLVEQIGFDVCYITGNGSMASLIGKPDIGLATMSEMVDRAHKIASCIKIPVICDADNGYGNLNNVKRTVEEFESAGVAGIHLEDQATPKRCGAMKGIKLISTEEAVDKIRVAVKFRSDPNFLIIARTDARQIYGLEEAIKRIRAFANVGADVVYVEMLESKEEILKVTNCVENTPVMYDVLEISENKIFSAEELEKLGVKIVIYALSSTLLIANKLKELFETIKITKTTKSYFNQMMPLHEYEKLVGFENENNIRKSIHEVS